MSFNPYKVLNSQAVSGVTNYYTSPTSPSRDSNSHVSYVVETDAGTLDGVVTIEVSNSRQEEINAGIDRWTTYTPIAPITVTNGLAGGESTFGIELKNLPFARSRLKYANASGTGTITVLATVN